MSSSGSPPTTTAAALGVDSLLEVPKAQVKLSSSTVTSWGFHPTEPLVLAGLSDGLLCLFTSRTDGISCLSQYAPLFRTGRRPEGNDSVTLPEPTKVIRVAAGGQALRHCVFLSGREDDLVQELLWPLLRDARPSSSSSSSKANATTAAPPTGPELDALRSMSRQMVFAVTDKNDAVLFNVQSGTVFLRWETKDRKKSIGKGSPLLRPITQVESYGALVYLTVGSADNKNENEAAVYVLHLAYSDPYRSPIKDKLEVSGSTLSGKPYCVTPRGSKNKLPVSFIRSHPLAPVLLVATAHTLAVYCIDGLRRAEPHIALSTRAFGDKATSLVDACFLATSVYIGNGGAEGGSSSVQNLQVATLTTQRVSVFDCSQGSLLDEQVFSTPESGLSYTRLYSWIGSPSTVLVEQSNGTIAEYTRNDAMTPFTRIMTLRSVRPLHPALTATARGAGNAADRRMVAAPTTLPLWGLLDLLPSSFGERANPSMDAHGSHRVLFSRPTSHAQLHNMYARGEASAFVMESIMADTDTIDCSAIRFSAILQKRRRTPASATSAGHTNNNTYEDVNKALVSSHLLPETRSAVVGRIVMGAPIVLVRMEHGFYFVGGRRQATNTFLLAGLTYAANATADGTMEIPYTDSSSSSSCRDEGVCGAIITVPASEDRIQRAAEGDATACRAHVAELLPPVFRIDDEAAAKEEGSTSQRGASKRLLSVSFQLSNDDAVPGAWALWSPQGRGTQLTFQSFYVNEERGEAVWLPPHLVQFTSEDYLNPTQVFSLSAVGGIRCTWPMESSILSQVFLYYEDRQLLVLGTVEQGSRYVVDPMHTMGTSSGTSPRADAGQQQQLRFIPQGAVHLECWRRSGGQDNYDDDDGEDSAARRRKSHMGGLSIQVSATLSTDASILLVAVACRRRGFAVVQFPVIGRTRESNGGVVTFVKERILFHRRWSQLSSVTTTDITRDPAVAALLAGSAEDADDGEDDTDSEHGDDNETALSAVDLAAQAARRARRPWVNASRMPVTLLEWAYLASTAAAPAEGGAASRSNNNNDDMEEHLRHSAPPFLALQRNRRIYVVHLSGAVVPLCAALTSSLPIGVTYTMEDGAAHHNSEGEGGEGSNNGSCSSDAVGGAADAPPPPSRTMRVQLQFGDYAGLLSQARRNRQAYQQHLAYRTQEAMQTLSTVAQSDTNSFFKLLHSSGGGSGGSSKKFKGLSSSAQVKAHLAAMQKRQESFLKERNSVLSEGSGAVFMMDITEALSIAVLKMQGMIISQAISDLVASSVLFSQYIRDTFEALSEHLETAVVHGDIRTAEILSTVPLAHVTYCLSHELRVLAEQQDHVAAGGGHRGKGGKANTHRNNNKGSLSERLSTVSEASKARQQWWFLLMRSFVAVSILNEEERDESQLAVQQALQASPEPFIGVADGQDGGSGGNNKNRVYTTEMVGEMLAYCPSEFYPDSFLAAMSAPDGAAAGIYHALVLIGASDTMASECVEPPGGDAAAKKKCGVADLVGSIVVDSNYWISAVFYCQLRRNLRALSSHSTIGKTEVLTQCLAALDGDQLPAVESVVEVAMSTVAALRGVATIDATAAAKKKMTAAVAVTTSRRLAQGNVSPSSARKTPLSSAAQGAAATLAAQSRQMVSGEDAYFSHGVGLMARMDLLCREVYACHWRCLYDLAAYPTRYLTVLSSNKRKMSTSSLFTPRELPAQAQAGGEAGGGAQGKGRDNKPVVRQQKHRAGPTTFKATATSASASPGDGGAASGSEAGAFAERPAVQITPVQEDVTVSSPTPYSTDNENNNTPNAANLHSGGGGALAIENSALYVPPADAIVQMLASEEARMRDTYFHAFNTAEDSNSRVAASRLRRERSTKRDDATAYFQRMATGSEGENEDD